MLRRQILTLAGVLTIFTIIAGCGYSYHSSLYSNAVAPDSTKIFTVNGKSYHCVNKDGTWRCESIADAQARAENSVFNTRNLDAKNPSPSKGNK
jgi:hypothetical protein